MPINHSRRARRLLLTILGGLLIAGLLPAGHDRAAGDRRHQPSPPVVTTHSGHVRGTESAGVDSFLGIPYAAPPIGHLRWAPPQPARPWQGIRAASEYGDVCPVAESSNGPRAEHEDCLFINVHRPSGVRPGDRRPVYVFIHGGGLINGSSNQADGSAIVRASGTIVVSFNYRLGVFGFLAHPALTKSQGESGNYGLMDQQAALRWVQRNIARFGGDPNQVTVGGESAGGWSVCSQLVAPGSRGLIDRAIMQSGSCPSTTQQAAETATQPVAQAVGCPGSSDTALRCLRRAAVGALLDVPTSGFPAPVRGTTFLPTDPRKAIATGRFNKVPTLIGANRDEGRTFSAGNIGWTKTQYLDWVQQTYGDRAPAVIRRYPWPAHADRFTAAYLTGAIITDSGLVVDIGGCPNLRLTYDFAAHTQTWAFEFDHRNGPGLTPEPAGYHWGAGHAAELAYLFPSFANNGIPITPRFDADERKLARQMKSAWGAFVSDGRPQTAGLPYWSPINRTGRIMSLRAEDRSRLITDQTVANKHRCAFWDTMQPTR